MPDQQHSHEQGVAALRAQLDDLTLAAAWAEGRTISLDQVVAYALESSATLLEVVCAANVTHATDRGRDWDPHEQELPGNGSRHLFGNFVR